MIHSWANGIWLRKIVRHFEGGIHLSDFSYVGDDEQFLSG